MLAAWRPLPTVNVHGPKKYRPNFAAFDLHLVAAVTVLAEIGDLSRFQNLRELMGISVSYPPKAPQATRSTAAASPKPAMVGRGVSWSKPLGAIGILHVLAARSR